MIGKIPTSVQNHGQKTSIADTCLQGQIFTLHLHSSSVALLEAQTRRVAMVAYSQGTTQIIRRFTQRTFPDPRGSRDFFSVQVERRRERMALQDRAS